MSILPSKCIQNPSPTSWLLQCSTSGGTIHGLVDVNSASGSSALYSLQGYMCRLWYHLCWSHNHLKPSCRGYSAFAHLLSILKVVVTSNFSKSDHHYTSPRVKAETCNDLWGLTSSALSPVTSLTLLTLFQPSWCLCGFLNIPDTLLPRSLCYLPFTTPFYGLGPHFL